VSGAVFCLENDYLHTFWQPEEMELANIQGISWLLGKAFVSGIHNFGS
jgi:hypothetical protein